MASSQQQHPLPPGYEARWDPGQNAYFYINHYDKSTTWVDPRTTYYAKQQKHKANDSSENIERNLNQLFPNVPDGIIRSVMASTRNQEDAIKQMKLLGFASLASRPAAASAKSPERYARHSDRSPSTSRSKNEHSSPSRTPQKSSYSNKTEISEEKKKALRTKLQREYNHMGKDIVVMALEACEYDEATTKSVLDATAAPTGTGNSRGTGTTSPKRVTYSPEPFKSSYSSEPLPSSLEPEPLPSSSEVFFDVERLTTSTGTDKNLIPKQSGSRANQNKENSKVKAKANGSKSNRSPVHRPKVSPTKKKTEHPKSSAYQTEPVGPNPLFQIGPDPNIRLVERVLVIGPDPSMKHGPDPERQNGTQGWHGHDPSLRTQNGHSGGVLVTNI